MSFDIATAGLYREVPAAPLRVWAGWLGAGREYDEEASEAGATPYPAWPSWAKRAALTSPI